LIFAWMLGGGLACGHASSAARLQPRAADASELSSELTEPARHFTHEHFSIATTARDALVDGDIAAVRAPLRAFADHDYARQAPEDWLRQVARLQAAARETSQAETLASAARGVASMARVCGECHKAFDRPLELAPLAVAGGAPASDAEPERMHRHFWATRRLWEGLVAPSDQAWRAGAEALARAPMEPPTTRRTPRAGFAEAMTRLREFGQRALAVESLDERIDVYALTLATCADCHAYREEFRL
jgi:hypothetical protein